jgi:hypothetical protein
MVKIKGMTKIATLALSLKLPIASNGNVLAPSNSATIMQKIYNATKKSIFDVVMTLLVQNSIKTHNYIALTT